MDRKTKRLQRSVSCGNYAEVVHLIEKNVDVNTRDDQGNCPIHYAVKGNYSQTLQLLLDNGAHINAVNEERSTALHIAVKSGSEKCVRILLNECINVNQVNNEGLTELMIAVMNGDQSAKKHRNWIIKQLINFPKINLKQISNNRVKHTALHYAAKTGCLTAVTKLLEKDPSLNYVRNAFDNLAIHISAANGHYNLIKEMQQLSPLDINVKGYNSRTSLQVAVLNLKYSTIELLIELNADCNLTDADGNTALHAAVKLYNSCCTKKSTNIVNCQSVSDHGNEIIKIRDSLFATHQNKCYNLALIAFLIEKGNATINAINNDGETPLSLVENEYQVTNLIKSLDYKKLKKLCVEENINFDVVQTTKNVDFVHQQDDLMKSENAIIRNNINSTSCCSNNCGSRINMLEKKVEQLTNEIIKMREKMKNVGITRSTDDSEQTINLCGMCKNVASYSLLCGHKICDDCYEENNCDCTLCYRVPTS